MRFPEGRVKDALRTARRLARDTGLHTWFIRRRLDACGCGLSKTGTHSIAGLFGNYRAEVQTDPYTINLAIRHLTGKLDEERAKRLLARRDRNLWLEMESSTLPGIMIEPLVRACPEKRFILTIRDVYSWFNSWADQNLNFPVPLNFKRLDESRLQPDRFPATRFDSPLQDRGFFPLKAYFSLWERHNRTVLDAVPDERLLIVKTRDIIDRIAEIAAFTGVPVGTLRPDRGWEHASPERHNLLSELDPGYVLETAHECCDDLMRRFFPEVRWEH